MDGLWPGNAELIIFGGFPEPFIKQNSRTLRRWHNEKVDRMFREDIRDMDQIRDIYGAQRLGDILPDRAGSLLSINSLREDTEVSHKAVSNWLNVLESFYYCFRVYPFVSKHFRALKKEPKLYLWDWFEISDNAARFENCVGSHLLKLVHFLQDYEGYRAKLHYLRSIEKKEVAFLVTIDQKPWFAVEVKLNDTEIAGINILTHQTARDWINQDRATFRPGAIQSRFIKSWSAFIYLVSWHRILYRVILIQFFLRP